MRNIIRFILVFVSAAFAFTAFIFMILLFLAPSYIFINSLSIFFWELALKI